MASVAECALNQRRQSKAVNRIQSVKLINCLLLSSSFRSLATIIQLMAALALLVCCVLNPEPEKHRNAVYFNGYAGLKGNNTDSNICYIELIC